MLLPCLTATSNQRSLTPCTGDPYLEREGRTCSDTRIWLQIRVFWIDSKPTQQFALLSGEFRLAILPPHGTG